MASHLRELGECKREALAPTNPSFKAALALAEVLDYSATDLVADLQWELGTGDHTEPITFELTRRVLKQNQGNYDALLKSAQALAQAVVALSADRRPPIRLHAILDDDGEPTGLKVTYEEMMVVRQLHKVLGMIKSGAKTMRSMINLINRLRTAHIDPNDDDETDDDLVGVNLVGVRVRVRRLTTIDVPLPDRVRFRNTLRHVEETINDPGSPFHLYRAPSLSTHG